MFDVIVIGGGINGAGIARDAALRGLKVLLLDKGDVGSGTSSWSTRLIHGGLRYLEHAEFGLVRESLRERERLLKMAPHLVRVIPMLVPVYRGARRGLLTIRAGMIAYDLLSFDKSLPRHRMLTRAQTLKQAPGLNQEGLLGAALYFDAQVEFAERLVVENVLSAIEHGAEVITYAQVNKLLIEDGRVVGVEYEDQLNTGSAGVPPAIQSQPPIARGQIFINASGPLNTGSAGVPPAIPSSQPPVARGQIFINASGPWVDQLLADSGAGGSPQLIGGTKGSHLIVSPFCGAPSSSVYVEAQTDGRPFFIIPWNNNYLIGTTDIRFEGDLDRVCIEEDEIDYLVRETNRVFPEANLTRSQILYTYSGVRPLAYADERDEQSITRRHFIRRHPRYENLLSIVGGKLTTYRSLAQEAGDLVCRQLGRHQSNKPNEDPLPGAASDFESYRKDFQQRSGFSEQLSDRLLRIYGVRAEAILDLIQKDGELAEVFDEETGAVAAEIVFAFQHEFAKTLTDCLMRRTMVGLNSTRGLEAVEKAASIAQKHLGWSHDRCKYEISEYETEVEKGQVLSKR